MVQQLGNHFLAISESPTTNDCSAVLNNKLVRIPDIYMRSHLNRLNVSS